MKPFALFCLVATLAWPLASAAQTPPAVEAFGRLPAVADAAISPDGRRVALATSQVDGQAGVVVVNLDQPSERSSYIVGQDVQLRAVNWADNERVSYLLTQTFRPGQVLPPGMYFEGRPRRVDYLRWAAVNTTTGRTRILTTNEDNPWADMGSRLISPIEGDPGHARMIGRTNSREQSNSVLYRVSLDDGHARPTSALTTPNTVDYIVDRTGTPVARLDADGETNVRRLYIYDGATPRLLLEDVSRFGQPFSILGLLSDGRLVAADTSEAGFSALYAVDRATGERTVLHAIENADVDGALRDPWTREIVGVEWTNVETEQRYFDPALQSVRDAVAATGQMGAFRIETWSQDRSRFIIYGEGGLDGGAYYLYDRNTSALSMLLPRYPELFSATLGARQSIIYRARDNTRIPAYLTLPDGEEARGLPLVLLVHGGPHNVRDTMDFDWWATFLASRGYAVLQPNFRGSGGYGDAWEEAGRGQWGGLMQTDVEDGVAALARAGIADEARVCIVGASYGGYAALAGATLTPERYRCTVAVAGVSDLDLMLGQNERQSGGADSMSSEWWRASIGDRREDRERIRSVSPVLMADRVQAPVLLIHGTDDTVVPIEQSRRMQRALEGAGKTVRFVELRGDDHWLSDAPTRIQMLREIGSFLSQHLPTGRVIVDDSAN